MKSAIAIFAAGILSASASAQAQTVIQQTPQQTPGRLAPMQGGVVTSLPPSTMPPGQGQIGGIALPQLPPDLQNPLTASQVSADIYAFMALFQKLAQEMRATAREQRSGAMETQVQALQDAAEKMKQAAAANMQQAQINGAIAIASGAMSLSAAQAGQAKAGTAGKTLQGQTMASPKVQVPAGGLAAANAPLQAPTKALTPQEKQQAIGSLTSAQQVFSANMAAADADKKKAEAAAMATSAQTAQQAQAQQMMQQMQDVIRDIQQKLQAIQQSQAATAQAIIRN